MSDKLKLKDDNIPIQKRYDSFAEWCNENNYWSTEVIASELEVELGVIEVFFDLAEFGLDEFVEIDKKGITIDALFIIKTYDKEVRSRIYENASQLLGEEQPLNAIKEYGDKILFGDYQELLNQVSLEAWHAVLEYIKQRDIVSGTITRKFPGLIKNLIKFKKADKVVTTRMWEWIARAILHDHRQDLNIFSNDLIKNDCPNDYGIFQLVVSQINSLIEE